MPSAVETDAAAYSWAVLAAKSEIHDVLMSYCRGVDRRGADTIAAAYHPGGVDRRPYGPDGVIETDGRSLAERAVASFAGVESFSQHHLTTVSIRVDTEAGVAAAESYVLAIHPMLDADGTERLRLTGGRYLDQFEFRDGRWAIAVREMIVDWSRSDISGDAFLTTLAAPLLAGAGAADPSAALFAPFAPKGAV